MDLRQLRYLVALADERHFTRAAEREHIAQPALSQQIRRLEQEVGVALVERTTRRVAMTEAGELLVARARRILAEVEAASDELQRLAGIHTGRVTVGVIHTMGSLDISTLLAAFYQRHPGVELTVREHPNDELAEMLRADKIDLAFLSVTERVESHGVAFEQVISEELMAVLPRGHRLANGRRVGIAELARENFIGFREGSRLRELPPAAGRHAGFEPRVKLESNESARMLRLVARGLGVAIMPRSECEGRNGDVVVAELAEPRLHREISLAWREGRRLAPAAAQFLALARQTFIAATPSALEPAAAPFALEPAAAPSACNRPPRSP